jgi:multiple sugar transport system substrate-binding protein
MVWINALVIVGRGARSWATSRRARDATPEIDSPAGDAAARIVGDLSRSPAAPPDMTTGGVRRPARRSRAGTGGFMVNWPYVYSAAKEDADPSVVADIGWARYPAVDRGPGEQAARWAASDLAIGRYTSHP